MGGKNNGMVALVPKAVENYGGSKPLYLSSAVLVRRVLGYV